MLENTEGAIQKDNPEKLATQGTQDKYMLENTEGAIKKGNPEKLATLGTQDKDKQKDKKYVLDTTIKIILIKCNTLIYFVISIWKQFRGNLTV